MMSYAFTGEWDKINSILGNEKIARHKLFNAKNLAMKKTTAFFQGQIKKNLIQSGRLADSEFKELSLVTIKIREWKRGNKKLKVEDAEQYRSKHKPLIDTAEMLNNVTPVVLDEDTGFIGVKRGKMHKKGGGEISDIAEKNEEERPFIGPVLDKFKDEAGEIYSKTLMEELFK
jgi:hypothetical protein